MKRIVLTGAAGRLGSYLREPLSKLAEELVSSDIAEDIGKLYPNEKYVKANLGEMDDIMPLLKGADMVVHFGAFVDEGPFEKLLGAWFMPVQSMPLVCIQRMNLSAQMYLIARTRSMD